jgi:threonine/homoserine/homoserine lactone efflux protein
MLVLTPGVGTASLATTVVSNGRKAGYLTALGMVAGATVYALAAALGISALLRSFPAVVQWIGLLGGLFVVYLGIRAIVSAIRKTPVTSSLGTAAAHQAFVRTGFFISLGNAPLPLFYLVVVPQYVPKTMTPLLGALLLSLIHITLAATWMTTLVTMLGQLVDVLRRPRVLLSMRLVTGIALVALGVKAISSAA